MSMERRLNRLEAAMPPPPMPLVPLTDEEVRLRLRAWLARMVFEDEAGVRYAPTPPLGLPPFIAALGRVVAKGPAPPGVGRLGDRWSGETVAVLDALLRHWCAAVGRGIWPDLDTTERGTR